MKHTYYFIARITKFKNYAINKKSTNLIFVEVLAEKLRANNNWQHEMPNVRSLARSGIIIIYFFYHNKYTIVFKR